MATVAKQSSRTARRPPGGGNGAGGVVGTVMNWPDRFREYVAGLRREMRLVTWPGKQQVQATTVVVLLTVFFFAVFFGVVDYVLAWGQTRVYQYFSN